MAQTRLYFDTRVAAKDGSYPLKVAFSHNGTTTFIPLDIRLQINQWDMVKGKVINHANKVYLNNYINRRKIAIDSAMIEICCTRNLATTTASQLRKLITGYLAGDENEEQSAENLFAARFLEFAEMKKPRTKAIYMATYNRMVSYTSSLHELAFEDITKQWLVGFDTFLSQTSPSKNARNIHLRNIRAVFNEAIDDEITAFYPFRRFKIRNTATVKRSLTVDELRTLFTAQCEPHAEKYLDMFKLIFYLIGINIIDLCKLTQITKGRIEYHRSKTDRLYNIKVEPEALEIIERYKGKDYLIDVLDSYKNYQDFAKRMNDSLQLIGNVKRVGRGGKKVYEPMFPNITTYWARHTWATIAASLEIPKETIAHALGHASAFSSVTDVYIDFDMRKVDEANRRVIDYVLYDKR